MTVVYASFLALATAATVASQAVDYFHPAEAETYLTSEIGRIPPVNRVAGHLAQVNATLPYCRGTNDVLALTFAAPILHNVDPSQFLVRVCPVREAPADDASSDDVGCPSDVRTEVPPECTVLPGDEPNERRTILLLGSFTKQAGPTITSGPQGVFVNAFSVQANGRVLPAVFPNTPTGRSWLVDPSSIMSYGQGPFLADISLIDLSAPLNTAAADPNGCAALHPSATYAVRLLFASAVHERAADGGLVPFGTNAAAAAALFSLVIGKDRATPSPDRVLGVADVDGDNVVDVCVEGAGEAPQVEAVVINCTAGELLAPEGFPCDRPIVAEMKPPNGPAPAFVQDVSLCFELDPSDCPSTATTTLQSVLAPSLLIALMAALTVAAGGHTM